MAGLFFGFIINEANGQLLISDLFFTVFWLTLCFIVIFPILFNLPTQDLIWNMRIIAQRKPVRFSISVLLSPIILIALFRKPRNPSLFEES